VRVCASADGVPSRGGTRGRTESFRWGGGALLPARFCYSRRGALIAVVAEELVFGRPEQGSA
jgi:hypothetical protein